MAALLLGENPLVSTSKKSKDLNYMAAEALNLVLWLPHIINNIQTTEQKIQCLILGKNDMHMHTILLQS
jgi:hypothetical protein